jgi:small GTP-binding protein
MNSYYYKSRPDRIRLKCIVLGAASAGKTSILRRYFAGTFEHGSRVPTSGSDYYTSKVRNPLYSTATSDEKKDESVHPSEVMDVIASQPFVSLQVWDTAGRERDSEYTTALSDAFFRNADAAMLVYDATSSTSFTQLLRWHSDLMERMKKLDKSKRHRPFPVLIVANKMDIIEQRKAHTPQRRKVVPQRDVLGLHGDFKGKQIRYEYRACPPLDENNRSKSRRYEISTYLATGNTWTTDGSYLNSVLNTEDRSHPDGEMVVLWCLRNGLKHIEVSALTGNGIDGAITALVELALESRNERYLQEKQSPEPEKKPVVENSIPAFDYQKNKELDLHQRYAPKKERCFLFRPFHHCCK